MKIERIGAPMRRYRLGGFVVVCFLILIGALSEEAGAASDVLGLPLSLSFEKMAGVSSAPLKDSGRDIPFEPVKDGILQLESFSGSSWFRIRMEDLIRELEALSLYPDGEGVLMFATPHVTHVDCFIPQTPATYARYTFGKASGNVLQFLYTRYPVLWLPSLRNTFTDGYLYLNVRSDYPVSTRLYLLPPLPFIRFFFKSLIIQLGFVGIMFSFVVTYFLFYLMTGEKINRTFMLIQLGATLFVVSFNGHLHAYLKLPVTVANFATWTAFGLTSIIGVLFFLSELEDRPRTRRAYRWTLYVQLLLAPALVAAALTGRFLWVFAGVLLSLTLNLAGSLLLFVSMVMKRTAPRALILYSGANLAFFAGIGAMFAGVRYAPYFLPALSYPDFFYMSCLILSPLLLVSMLLSESRVRFDSYNLLKAQSSHYRELSQRDGLTGLYNRSYLEHALEDNVKRAERTGRSLSFLMLDIDHFKNFNDTWGHQEGDRALELVARVIRDSLREQDVAARYGGEEFSVILSGAGLPIANIVAERIRKSCKARSLSLGSEKTLTVSLGIALFHPGDTPASLIRRADEALYRAKKSGRNRAEVEIFAPGAPHRQNFI